MTLAVAHVECRSALVNAIGVGAPSLRRVEMCAQHHRENRYATPVVTFPRTLLIHILSIGGASFSCYVLALGHYQQNSRSAGASSNHTCRPGLRVGLDVRSRHRTALIKVSIINQGYG